MTDTEKPREETGAEQELRMLKSLLARHRRDDDPELKKEDAHAVLYRVNDALCDAWRIIDILNMPLDTEDNAERPWSRASEWLKEWK